MSQKLVTIATAANVSAENLGGVVEQYPFALTPFLEKRIKDGSYSLQALKQFLPDVSELDEVAGFLSDPTNEEGIRPVQNVLHTYGNRLLVMVTNKCAAYCRFCFRKAFVGKAAYTVTDKQLGDAITYVHAHPEIEEIILSGGDPLVLKNRRLLPFLKGFQGIEHVKVIRIDSRVLTTMPERIDDELLAFLKQDGRYQFHTHMNHPDDLDHPEVFEAVGRLRNAGIPLFNQGVILRGINDDPATMLKLMRLCYYTGIKPYNLYIADPVKGTAHFSVPSERILEICRALAQLSGPAQPTIVYVDGTSQKQRMLYHAGTEKAFLDFLARREAFLQTLPRPKNDRPERFN